MSQGLGPSADQTVANEGSAKFNLAQMLIATAILAVVFACAFSDSPFPGQPKPKHLLWKGIFGMSAVFVGATSLFGGWFVSIQCWRERSYPKHPGHLLFLFLGASFLLTNALGSLFAFFLETIQSADEVQQAVYLTGFLYVQGLTQLCLGGALVFGATRDRWWWRVAFLVLAISASGRVISIAVRAYLLNNSGAISVSVFANLRIVMAILFAIAMLWLIVCCVVDLAKKQKRDRMHWLGVGCFLICSFLPMIVNFLAMRYLGPAELFDLK